MSIRALSWSCNLPLHDMAAKAALNALAWHADKNGVCWPSADRLALFAGCDDKTIRRALRRLAGLGLIERQERPGKSDLVRLNMSVTVAHTLPTESIPTESIPTESIPNEAQTLDSEAQDPPHRVQTPSPPWGGNHQELSKNLQNAARAAGDPDGPPPPRPALTSVDKWADRLAKHRPQDGKPCWTNAWGPQPDSAGHNPLIPPNLYRQWREQYDRDMAALKAGAAA